MSRANDLKNAIDDLRLKLDKMHADFTRLKSLELVCVQPTKIRAVAVGIMSEAMTLLTRNITSLESELQEEKEMEAVEYLSGIPREELLKSV